MHPKARPCPTLLGREAAKLSATAAQQRAKYLLPLYRYLYRSLSELPVGGHHGRVQEGVHMVHPRLHQPPQLGPLLARGAPHPLCDKARGRLLRLRLRLLGYFVAPQLGAKLGDLVAPRLEEQIPGVPLAEKRQRDPLVGASGVGDGGGRGDAAEDARQRIPACWTCCSHCPQSQAPFAHPPAPAASTSRRAEPPSYFASPGATAT